MTQPMLVPVWAAADWLRRPRSTVYTWIENGLLDMVIENGVRLVDYDAVLLLRDTQPTRRRVKNSTKSVNDVISRTENTCYLTVPGT